MIDRDNIIRMAREAHWATAHGGMPTTSPWWDMDVPALERFAALVAAAEQKKWQDQTVVEIHEAVLDEREACAAICDHYDSWGGIPRQAAAAIRARGQQ